MMFILATVLLPLLGIVLPDSPTLSLLPSDKLVIKQVDKDSSWFVSCQQLGGTRGQLFWQRQLVIEDKLQLVNISVQPQNRVHSELSSGGLDLVFRSISRSDHGNYSCVLGRERVNVELWVIQQISFGDTNITQTVKLNSAPHRIKCEVTGHPFPTVTWRVKGLNIRNYGEVSRGNSKYEVDGTDLVINNLEREDEGSYLCKAVQTVVGNDGIIKFSDFRDLVIHLKIEQSPSWLDDNVSGQFYGYVTGTANLTCQAEAEPPPTFHWLDAENQPVTSGTMVSEEYKSVLMLPVVHHAVFGAYTCVAENVHGRLEKVLMLTEGAKPGTPHIDPREIFPDAVNLHIEEPLAEMFLRIEGFQVEIKEVNKTWDTIIVLENFSLATSSLYSVSGLRPNCYYHVRAKSRNKAGLSDASNTIYLHTPGLSAYPRRGVTGQAVKVTRTDLRELALVVGVMFISVRKSL